MSQSTSPITFFCQLILLSTALLTGCQPQVEQVAKQHQAMQIKAMKATAPSSEQVSQQAAISSDFSAHWLSNNLLLLPTKYQHFQINLQLNAVSEQLLPEVKQLTLTKIMPPDWLATTVPHLQDFDAYQVELTPAQAKHWLKHQPQVRIIDQATNNTVHIAKVQTAGIIDQLFTDGANDADEIMDYGASVGDSQVQFKLWAPTAQQVSVLLFDQQKQLFLQQALVEDSATGSWQLTLPLSAKLERAFYQYQLTVFHPTSGQLETLITTDPYSLSLSTNSQHSQITDLNRASTKPQGWDQHQAPALEAPEDNIFYEVHIGDFSAAEQRLANEKHRGKYAAFSEQNSDGINHLRALKQAGLNNIHLLPTFDIGTVNEDASQQITLRSSFERVCQLANDLALCHQQDFYADNATTPLGDILKTLPPRSSQAQAIVSALRTKDNYNWGYDPFHYTVPEGSYALNPDGESRIIEFRQMVQRLHNMGFRVIMDVVYNHTHQAGLEATAVLDKIVPNYYHRLHPITGAIEQSTCCDNTATEHTMMAKLMIDSLKVWTRDYKIDGFRFDLMAHQPKATMLAARAAVQAIDADNYFYGEGWNFGEVANHQRFEQASQLALGGTEIGTFSDRLRDAVRGPGIGVSGKDIRRNQGIGNGLGTIANDLSTEQQNLNYQVLIDQLKVGLAGNLANFPLLSSRGDIVSGKDIPYGDQPTGYALDPADTINYVSKHDNQTLWDNNQYRSAYQLTTEQRVRMHIQSLSFVLMAQGIPFLHMGSEFIRSKSFLRDSYDYGDWFNHVDFSGQGNNYDVGLPPADKDQDNWQLITEVLENNQGRDKVTAADIVFSKTLFLEFLAIRSQSPLFRLRSAQDIIQRLKFLNTGRNQQAGLIVMQLNDTSPSIDIDPQFSQLMVLFNTSDKTKTFDYQNDRPWQLHPIQQLGQDPVVKSSQYHDGTFSIAPLTTAIFISPQ